MHDTNVKKKKINEFGIITYLTIGKNVLPEMMSVLNACLHV